MVYLLYTVHIVVCIFLILVVLLQQGSGADLSVFGGGATQTVFGARGAATLLHKLTVGAFIAFILTTISIGFFQGGDRGSVFSGAPAAQDEGMPTGIVEPATPEDEAGEEGDGEEPASGPADGGEAPAEEPSGEASGGSGDAGS